MKRRRSFLRYPADTHGVMAPYGWIGTPSHWHVAASDPHQPPYDLATKCGRSLVDGVTSRAPEVGEVVCRTCPSSNVSRDHKREVQA
jgi:hypothetical protein